LRQDISFFDQETNSGEVVGRMSGDTVLIQEAMGEKVLMDHSPNPNQYNFIKLLLELTFTFSFWVISQLGKFIQNVSSFLGAIALAFTKGWLLSLVLLSSVPLLVLSGSMMSLAFAKMASRGQEAYSEAATVVEQTIGSIRTVCSHSECTLFFFYFPGYKRVVHAFFPCRLRHLQVRSKL